MSTGFLVLLLAFGSPPASHGDEVAVYRAVLAEPSCSGLGPAGRSTLVVQREAETLADEWWSPITASMRTDLGRWFPQAQPQEIQAFLEAKRSEEPLPVAALDAPGLIVIDAATLRAIDGGSQFWEKFYERYPGATGYIRLARVRVRPQQQQVFAYCGRQYGLVGGEGTLFLLGRARTGWAVTASWLLWES